ncbi:hypothetical protein C2U70_00185 [Bradyrhizobium guangdongense]|uniref:protoglobin domain-containing protein n=1 Tax=Bradyrhizobium guangdongense TaxID=1325090 RepID=UPI00112BC066|nr:protoglobin domain-containing protein [Bradyrhizobium guangdongense]TPQ43006.1 hypothetical protein C2U70_00185 [Bradyrhizobium guangdongense]
MEALITVLDIDVRSRRMGRLIWPMIEDRSTEIVEAFYAGACHLAADPSRSLHAIDRLKACQHQHWKGLFEGRFDDAYVRSASLLGIAHCELGLDCKWHVIGYARMKSELTRDILGSSLSATSQVQLLAVLDKYLAIDMAISLSSYSCILLD